LRPILKKSQFAGGLNDPDAGAPIGSAPYMVSDVEMGRFVTLTRNPDYWGADLGYRKGTHNLDEIRIEFYGDAAVLQEAFKAGVVSYIREFNAEKWASQYDFPAISNGTIVKSEIPHQKPSGMTGFCDEHAQRPIG